MPPVSKKTKSVQSKKGSSSSSSKNTRNASDNVKNNDPSDGRRGDTREDEEDEEGATSILEQYIDGISALPADIIKSLELMRELDERCNGIVDQVRQQIENPNLGRVRKKIRKHHHHHHHEEQSDQYEMDSNMTDDDDHDDDDDDHDDDNMEEVTQGYVDERFREALRLSEEKIQISAKCYEEVDRCIRKLDQELARFSKQRGDQHTQQQQQLQKMQHPNSHIIRTTHQNHRVVLDALTGKPMVVEQLKRPHAQRESGTTTGAGITGTTTQSYMLNHMDNNYYRHTGAPLNLPASVTATATATASLSPAGSALFSMQSQQYPTTSSLYQQPQHAAGHGHRRKVASAQVQPEIGTIASGPAQTPTSGIIENDMPIDPNEPVYCICQRVSFGDMVACDNDACPYEWFHFPCVGLVESPKGKWYCPHCREQQQQTQPRSKMAK